MNLKLVTGPSATAVSLATVKAHLRLPSTYTDEDTTLQIYLEAAIKTAEDRTNRALMSQTWKAVSDRFPAGTDNFFRINKTPFVSITHIKYYDTAGTIQTLNAAAYVAAASDEPFRIYPAPGYSWPLTQVRPEAVTITFVAGYTSAALIPKNIIAGILLIVDDLYKQRGSVIIGNIVNSVPLSAERLFESERVSWL